MPTLIDRHGPRDDAWVLLPDSDADAPLPDAAQLLVSFARWRRDGAALLAGGRRIGVQLAPADDPADLGDDIGRLSLIAVEFPSFTDGRGYSTARLLRSRYHYTGELRAVGDVLRDQLFYLARCGFDTFLLADGVAVADALTAFGDFSETYQSAVDRGPLFERRAAVPADIADLAIIDGAVPLTGGDAYLDYRGHPEAAPRPATAARPEPPADGDARFADDVRVTAMFATLR
ncbi:MAG: DUF934 domain-containing protein [Lautropia sp.]